MQEEISYWPNDWPELVHFIEEQRPGESDWNEIWLSQQRQEMLIHSKTGWLRLILRPTGRLRSEIMQGKFIFSPETASKLGLKNSEFKYKYAPKKELLGQDKQTDYFTLDHLLQNPEFLEKGWHAFFPEAKGLNLEIGCGYAHFLSWLAPRHPEQAFIGLDIISKVLRRAARRLNNLDGDSNVRLAKLDAHLVLRELIAPASLEHLYILFPDPWPKGRHQGRRTLRADTLQLFASRLKRGGRLIFVSDDPDYAHDAHSLLESSDLFEATDFPDIEVKTKYERKWLEQNKEIYRLAYTRKAHPNLLDRGQWQQEQIVSERALPPFSPSEWESFKNTELPTVLEHGKKLVKIQNFFMSPNSEKLLMRLVLAEPGTMAQHGWLTFSIDGHVSIPDFGIFPALLDRKPIFEAIQKHFSERHCERTDTVK